MKSWLFQNIANFITLFGLLATIWLSVIAINSPEQLWLILLLAMGIGLTDFVDGRIARFLKIKSEFGAALDRLRDKIFICPILIILAWCYGQKLAEQSILISTLTKALIILIVLIELILLTAWLIAIIRKLDISSSQWGRAKMLGEFIVVIFWLVSLAVEKYFGFPLFRFSIYLIDLILLVTTYLAIKSLEGYWKRYTA